MEETKMKIICNSTGKVVKEILGGENMTMDEALNFVGEIHPEMDDENVEIEGKWYYYDDLHCTI